MENNFNMVKLKDVLNEKGYIRGPFGSDLKRSEMVECGIPVYEQSNAIYNNRIFRYFIDKNKFEKLKRFQVKADDIIISCSGTVGCISIIRETDPLGIISQALLILRPNRNIILPEFLMYFFESNMGRNSILSRSSGSVQVNIAKRDIIEKIDIYLPNISEQEKVVTTLSLLDKKIYINNEMNKTLEKMAQAIFKSWFVDFEPFKDGEFEESELGIIPKGWKVVKLGEIGDVKGGKRLPKGSKLEDIKTEHPYLRVTDVTNGYVDLAQIKYIADEVSDSVSRYIINKEDIYISIAGTIGVCGIIPKSISGANLTENMARIIPNDNNYRNYILLYLNSKNGKSVIKSRTVGSTQPKLPLYGIKDVPILYNEDVIKKFNKAVDGILERIQHNLEQNNELKNIRDTLLPKLISGEIKL